MAIYVRCPECKSEQVVKNNREEKTRLPKKCKNKKCGRPLPREDKQFRIIITRYGQTVKAMVTGSLLSAKDTEAKIKAEMIEGSYFNRKKKGAIPTLNEVWQQYFTWAKAETKSWKTRLSQYKNNVKEALGNKKLDRIAPINIERLLLDLQKQGKAPKGRKDILELINRLFNYASVHNLYQGPNPVVPPT